MRQTAESGAQGVELRPKSVEPSAKEGSSQALKPNVFFLLVYSNCFRLVTVLYLPLFPMVEAACLYLTTYACLTLVYGGQIPCVFNFMGHR